MKYNTNKKMTRGAKRTLNDFMCTMFTMLSEKNFEEITVGELCKCANYPRATFYNYFDDKFDLLNVSAKYSCGFSNLLDSSIIVNER